MEGEQGYGAWVRERRKALWLTQKKLARLVGCAPVTVQKIEEGQRRPSLPTAEHLARHLEIDPCDLERFLRLARTSPTPARTSRRSATPTERVPLPLTPLIGREAEVSSLSEILLHAHTRLLTLTGPPGVGKTRLAQHLALELRPHFADGVFMVMLAELDDPDQLLPSLMRGLGLSDGGTRPRLARLQAFLRAKQVLVVLDNLEHLLPATPPLSDLLEQGAGLRLLVTSRAALSLYGEREWPIQPLPLPAAVSDVVSHFGPLEHNPAIRLFLERVQAFDPSFRLSPHNAPDLVEVVTRLEGLPLALELAAGRLRHARLSDLTADLRENVLGALGPGPRDWPARHRTLSAAIAWSVERLEPGVQRVFRHLGVFVGSFDAAAAVALTQGRAEDLHTLEGGHLLEREGGRYRLLESLRAFALERLEAHGERAAAREAHLGHYLKSVGLRGDRELDWLESELGNLRAALRLALERGAAEPALRLALGLKWFWETRGYQREGLEWFGRALALPGEVAATLRLPALNWGSTLAWQTGAFALSHRWLAEGVALSQNTRDLEWEASLRMQQGKVAFEQGLYREALEALEPALALSHTLKSPALLSATLFQLADATLALGQPARARGLAEQGLAVCRSHPGLFWEPNLLRFLGNLALSDHDFLEAGKLLGEALNLAAKLEHALMLSRILADFAASLTSPDAEESELLRAARLWGAVETLRETHGYPRSPFDQARLEHWSGRTRARLPDLEWTLAWSGGRTLTLNEALELSRAAKSFQAVSVGWSANA